MNGPFKKQDLINIAIYVVSIIVAALLAYGVVQQKIAVDEEKIIGQQQQIEALSLRTTALEVQIKNTATTTDITNIRRDIQNLSNNFQAFVQGFVLKDTQR